MIFLVIGLSLGECLFCDNISWTGNGILIIILDTNAVFVCTFVQNFFLVRIGIYSR